MEEQLRNLILKLEKENQERKQLMENIENPWQYFALTVEDKTTTDILKQLKEIY